LRATGARAQERRNRSLCELEDARERADRPKEKRAMSNRLPYFRAFVAPVLALAALALPARAQAPNLVQTAVANGNFTTLVAALQATGLDAALSGTDRLTVFASTDAAFAALPPGTVQNLLQPENLTTLSAILKYHVVAGG
jgi:hypothetical protein